jgi:hypothetical protein
MVDRPRRRLLAGFVLLGACGGPATITDPPDAGPPDAEPPPPPDAAPPDAMQHSAVELFATAGLTFTFDVLPAQANLMDQGSWGGQVDPTFAEDITITDLDGVDHSYGKVGLRTVGQSTFQEWARKPNLRIDSNEAQPGLKIGGVEHFRFNNGRVGGLLRETVNLRIWDALGYPTPDSVHAWVRSPQQWGANFKRPYLLIEVYKESWAKREFGDGEVLNMWEGVYNFQNILDTPDGCQFSTCDNTTLQTAASLITTAPEGDGFEDHMASVINWDMFHRYQCLAWMMGTGDDYIHNQNNLLIVERLDGRLQFHPYSSDISAGIQVWGGGYENVFLQGYSELANGCQQDTGCWQDTLTVCDELLTEFEALDPATTIVQPLIDELTDLEMMEADPLPDDDFLFWEPQNPPTDTEDAAYVLNWYQHRAQTCRDQLAAM